MMDRSLIITVSANMQKKPLGVLRSAGPVLRSCDEPMTDEWLAEIEKDHIPGPISNLCSGCNHEMDWPCDAVELVAEVRRLRRENQLMRLSQGDLGAVGQD